MLLLLLLLSSLFNNNVVKEEVTCTTIRLDRTDFPRVGASLLFFLGTVKNKPTTNMLD
jgi:hypothetical protein